MWEILGIAQTHDKKAIKQAYAKKLKQTHPQDDPVAFQALRQAYDWALQEADYFKPDNAGSEQKIIEALGSYSLLFEIKQNSFDDAFFNKAKDQSKKLDNWEGNKIYLDQHPSPNNEIKIEKRDVPPDEDDETENFEVNAEPKLKIWHQDPANRLQLEARSHANHLLKLLEDTEMHLVKGRLTQYLENDWFVHIEAKTILEALLLEDIYDQRISPSYKVFAALVELFEWKNQRLFRSQRDEMIMETVMEQFHYERALYNINNAGLASWRKRRILSLWTNPPKPMTFRWYALNPLLLSEAKRIFSEWDEECPEIYSHLNFQSVAWWRDKIIGNIKPLIPLDFYTLLQIYSAVFIGTIISTTLSINKNFDWVFIGFAFIGLTVYRHRRSTEESWLTKILSKTRGFVKTRHGRLVGIGYLFISIALMQLTVNDWSISIATLGLYFALLAWMEKSAFLWAAAASLTTIMMINHVPAYINNKLFTLHLLGMLYSGLVFRRITLLSQQRDWSEKKHETLFVISFLLVFISPICLEVFIQAIPDIMAYIKTL
jgi:curved DNA-binding protein CbpA